MSSTEFDYKAECLRLGLIISKRQLSRYEIELPILRRNASLAWVLKDLIDRLRKTVLDSHQVELLASAEKILNDELCGLEADRAKEERGQGP